MGLLQNLIHDIGAVPRAVHQNIDQPLIDTAQMVNRNTPWGQANQANYNAQHTQQAQGLQPVLHQPQLQGIPMHGAGQQPNLGVSMLRVQGNNINPGGMQLQSSNPGYPSSVGSTVGMQPASMPHWQNTGGGSLRNYLNPQTDDNSYFYDN